MSTYNRKSSLETSDDRPRSSRRIRRSQLFDNDYCVTSNNNPNDDATSKSALGIPDKNRQPTSSDSRSPARNRKSKLIEAMAANFEKKDAEARPAITTQSQRNLANGDLKSSAPAPSPEPEVVESVKVVEQKTPSPSEPKKVGPSARRGKAQRDKRMLRQKRRSTGVVNQKDLDDIDVQPNTEGEVELQNETDANTITNELSPVSAYTPPSRITVSKTETSSVRTSNGTYESNQSTTLKASYTPSNRHHATRSDDTSNIKLSNKQAEVEELRAKLESAETTISKLRKEIKAMDKELHGLEEENHRLKEDNKMLEDENATMLRLMRR